MNLRSRNRKYRIVDLCENALTSIFFWSIFAVLFLQFFTRYVLNDSFGWTEEIARVLLICLCFSGAMVNARKSTEISLEFTRTRLPPHLARLVDLYVVKIFSACVYLSLAWIAGQYALKTRQSLSSIYFPKKYIIWFVCVCLAMMGIRTIQTIIVKTINHRS